MKWVDAGAPEGDPKDMPRAKEWPDGQSWIYAEQLGQKPRQAFGPVRRAVTGSNVSPGLFESLELLGKDESLTRLAAAAAAAG